MRRAERVKLTNCRLVRDGQLVDEDLWWAVPVGSSLNARAKIIDPKKAFWTAQAHHQFAADYVFDCHGLIVSPGFIDLQINGAFGVDFTSLKQARTVEAGRTLVGKQQGSTSFSSDQAIFDQQLKQVFDSVAAGQDGILSKKEFNNALRKLATDISSNSMAAAWDDLDADGQGFVTYESFSAHFKQVFEDSQRFVDSSLEKVNVERYKLQAMTLVSKQLLRHGVTSYCPTVITSSPETYRETLHVIRSYMDLQKGERARSFDLSRRAGVPLPTWTDGVANVLGLHLEGPFISIKGAHPEQLLRVPEAGIESVVEVYGELDRVKIVTIAPELKGAQQAIQQLRRQGVVPSLGHSAATIQDGIKGVQNGGRFMTHLFNAMQPFHHRDPGLIGLLGMNALHSKFFYGMIADGIHAHPASINMAIRAHPKGAILVTDAMEAMGLEDGQYTLGSLSVDIGDNKAVVTGTDTLAGAIANLPQCLRNLRRFTGISLVEALDTVTLHPAQCLGIEDRKGRLVVGADADIVLLDDDLNVQGCFVNGQLVWVHPNRITLTFPTPVPIVNPITPTFSKL